MLYSTILRLLPVGESRPGPKDGYHAYALFLSLIRKVNPALADRLHSGDTLKPFTVSPLHRNRLKEEQDGDCHSGYWLRFTVLDDTLFSHLMDAILRLPEDMLLSVGKASFRCQELVTLPGQSHWVNCTTFEKLLDEVSSYGRVYLQFSSPTTFRGSSRGNLLFPEPSLVFGSLLAKWNSYSPVKFAIKSEEIPLLIRPAIYRLETRMVDFGSHKELGFVGHCGYEVVPKASEEVAKAINALASFAFYAGVGAKTTMGMGQCRRIDNAGPISDRTRGHPQERGRDFPHN